MIKEFSKNYDCELTIMKNGDRFFHTKEQLEFYKNWLDTILNLKFKYHISKNYYGGFHSDTFGGGFRGGH